jgi:hypothetical protein
MRSVEELIVNIVAAIIVFALGVGARSAVTYIRSRRGRRFWGRQIMKGQTRLFLEPFHRDYALEPSGFVGLGDSHAVYELATELGRLGVFFEIAYASRLVDRHHHDNLILLGFGDMGSLAPTVLEMIRTNFVVDADGMTITDTYTNKVYGPEWEERSIAHDAFPTFGDNWSIVTKDGNERFARRLRADYGLLIRTRSPFKHDRTLIVIAGIFGYGTWAGARLPLDDVFLHQCENVDGFSVECLYRVQVLQGQLIATSVETLRAIPVSDPADTPPS